MIEHTSPLDVWRQKLVYKPQWGIWSNMFMAKNTHTQEDDAYEMATHVSRCATLACGLQVLEATVEIFTTDQG
jgi:hypothetical protein